MPINQSGETYKIPLSSAGFSTMEWPSTNSAIVKTFAELQAANSDTNITHILLGRDITITSSITIAATKVIFFQKYKFIKSGSATVRFLGSVEAGRYQIFSGYSAGNITGPFKNSEIYPEWWGMTTNRAELAINSAISAVDYYNQGNTVSLAAGTYYTGGPIDLRGSLTQLVGAGSGATTIYTTSAWTPSRWMSSFYYFSGGPFSGANYNCRSGAILIGGDVVSGHSFRTGIRGVTINCYEATKNNPTKKVCGITCSDYVEENTIIEDICINNFSGFGIGFESESGTHTVNGVTIRNFWITASVNRDSVPIYIPYHAAVCTVKDGTIDVRVSKGQTIYATSPPALTYTWPVYGVLASGYHTTIDNLHIEGCLIGVQIYDVNSPPCSVTVSNIDTTWMMASALSGGEMRWYTDWERLSSSGQFGPAPSLAVQLTSFGNPTLMEYTKYYGVSVNIGKINPAFNAAYLYNTTAVITNIRNTSYWTPAYLLRDALYNVHYSAWGKGQYPNIAATSSIAFYARSAGWVHQTNSNDLSAYPYRSGAAGTDSVTNVAYSTSSPDTSRTYYLGPI